MLRFRHSQENEKSGEAVQRIEAPICVGKSFAALLLGFPFACLFAWAFELTPEGVKKTVEVDRSQSITHSTGKRLNAVIIISLRAPKRIRRRPSGYSICQHAAVSLRRVRRRSEVIEEGGKKKNLRHGYHGQPDRRTFAYVRPE
jgi:hypothetical protein